MKEKGAELVAVEIERTTFSCIIVNAISFMYGLDVCIWYSFSSVLYSIFVWSKPTRTPNVDEVQQMG